MPLDPYRTVVAALDRLTTQVGRVADAMPTPVIDADDGPQTTDDDAFQTMSYDTRQHASAAVSELLRTLPSDALPTTAPERDMLMWHAVNAALDALPEHPAVVELARIRRALDPDDETYVRETVDEQFALQAKVDEATAILRRVRTLHRRETVQTVSGPADACSTCETDSMSYPWPCPTIEALSGPDDPFLINVTDRGGCCDCPHEMES
ncbi:hypothetical protein [Streptomyces sp. NPDC048332]|uniref:hypothetical protein n=1 Tax=Streptomyces sp. NPDC048332 TaxID=3154619 RepID=UPI003448BCE3